MNFFRRGTTSLQELRDAINANDIKLVETLLKKRNYKKDSIPISEAVMAKNIPMVELLLQYGSVNETLLYKESPINIAVRNMDIDMVKLLLSKGAMVEYPLFGEHLLAIAVRNKDIDMVKLLLKYGAMVKYSLVNQPLLAIAVRNKDIDMVRLLLKYGVSPDTVYCEDLHDFISEEKNKDIYDIFLRANYGHGCIPEGGFATYGEEQRNKESEEEFGETFEEWD